jgi:hypothetical protein
MKRWTVIGSIVAVVALLSALLLMTVSNSPKQTVAAPPEPVAAPAPLPRLGTTPPGEVSIPPSKAYSPRSVTPPSASINTWPDKNRTRAFEQLKNASMAFNIDSKFNVEETGKAQVVIDFSKQLQELKDELSAGAKAGSITGGAVVQVSKVVIATLVAPGLTITPITPSEQAVLETEPTIWLWDISANKPGKYDVRIILTASIIIDGRATNRFLRMYDQVVTIEITRTQQVVGIVKQHWQWAFSSLLVPLGVWLWRRYRRNKDDQ